jgi:hypothetical protein
MPKNIVETSDFFRTKFFFRIKEQFSKFIRSTFISLQCYSELISFSFQDRIENIFTFYINLKNFKNQNKKKSQR